jgi:hypothetical protein
MASIPRPSPPGRAVLAAPVFVLALASSGCAVVSVAGTAVSVVGSTVRVAGKVVEKTVDLAVPGGAPATAK